MTPSLCSLLLWLYAQRGAGYFRVDSLTLVDAIDDAISRGLVERIPSCHACDQYYVRLTEHGKTVAAEGKQAMEGAA